MTELFSKYEQAQFSSMFHTGKERPEPLSNGRRPSTADNQSVSQIGMNGIHSPHDNTHGSEQFSHLSLFEDGRDRLASSADHSLSSSNQTNSGDSWHIRPSSNAEFLYAEGSNMSSRPGNYHGDGHHVSAQCDSVTHLVLLLTQSIS